MKIELEWTWSGDINWADLIIHAAHPDQPKSICLNEDKLAEALMLVKCTQLNMIPSAEMKIHCWRTCSSFKTVFWFVNLEQNNAIQQALKIKGSCRSTHEETKQ